MAEPKKKTVQELAQDKERKTMNIIAWKCAYFRSNPHRFVEEVLGIHLKLFQKILLWAMMQYNYFMFIAARGMSKTWLTALFCVVRCILYPGTKIVVCSGILKQANGVLLKIQDELMKHSPILCSEIEKCNIGQNDAIIMFKNGSWITTRTSTDNARGARANIVVMDEFRMIDENIVNMVIRKFLTSPRQPGYLNRKEYSHLQERNKEIYMSSAWFKSSWAWKKFQAYVLNFFDDKKKYFVCALPYQLSIKEGLLSRDQIIDEMSENDFNELAFIMEMGALWFGDEGNNLFKFEEFNKRRRIKYSLLPLEFYNDKLKVPAVNNSEERILSVDVALMASKKKKKNDAAALYINNLIQTDDVTYHSNFVYGETFEGLTTDALGIIVMRYFYEYKCTQLVIDTQGLGIGVYDFICKDQYDSETGKTYKALKCCNDDDMAIRCKVKDANTVVWSVKANDKFNNEICVLLRNGIENGKVSFLISESDCEEVISKELYKGYNKLTPTSQARIKNPYLQTTMAEYELIKLDHEVKNGNIKVKEQSGMRKDRYSSIAYNYWCACQLELGLKPQDNTSDLLSKLASRIHGGIALNR